MKQVKSERKATFEAFVTLIWTQYWRTNLWLARVLGPVYRWLKDGWGQIKMKVISFKEDHKVIDKIINHLKPTFKAGIPPPPKAKFNMADEERS